MPYSNNSGGPWGGGGNNGGGGPWGGGGGGDDGDGGKDGNRPKRPQKPTNEIDDLLNKGRERLTSIMGGGGGGGGGEQLPGGIGKGGIAIVAFVAVLGWLMASFYSVKPEEQSVELFLGKEHKIGNPGLNFAHK